jgi:N6-L-threonylcarbamoyladenine synthase
MAPDGTTIILGIESSCDETAAAVLVDGVLRSNVIAGQDVHRLWGGVVPELASRAHQEHIVPVVDEALRQAGVEREQLSGIAFTQGPGLIGALLVGACFARSMAQALHVPLLAVHHISLPQPHRERWTHPAGAGAWSAGHGGGGHHLG